MKYKIAVCIATWCRKDNLRQIVELLEVQSLNQEEYQIVVCDSFSNDGTQTMMENLCVKYSNIKYINDKRNILAVKRNIGIDNSDADIIVFMDDDVFPTYTFLEEHLIAHKNSVNTIFCGQVRFPKEWVNNSNYYRYRDDAHLGRKDVGKILPHNKIVVMNMSFKKREFFDNVGKVCEEFIGYGCEDLELGYRINQSKMKMIYLESALAYHQERSESIKEYGNKIYRAARDGNRILKKICPDAINGTKNEYLENQQTKKKLKFKIKSYLYRLIINKYIAEIVCRFLIKTDKNKKIYLKHLYKYYLAFCHKNGLKDQYKKELSVEDVKNGWYS